MEELTLTDKIKISQQKYEQETGVSATINGERRIDYILWLEEQSYNTIRWCGENKDVVINIEKLQIWKYY